jgi:hypothetical protein
MKPLLYRAQRVNRTEELVESFSLLCDLGILTVPDEYQHQKQFERFYGQTPSGRRLGGPNFDFVDANLPTPSYILKPGDRLHVEVFRIGALPYPPLTWQDCLNFLRYQKAVFPGAQGASLVFEQKFTELPKRYWCYVLDRGEGLPRNAFSGRVGMIGMTPPNHYVTCPFFGLYDLHSHAWEIDECLLCFR